MYSRHEEYTGLVGATAELAFEHLDDQRRLSAHMSKPSWKMGWGRMELRLDGGAGQAIGSRIVLDGRVLGMRLYLEEVVIEREPPRRKRWETIGEPRLLVIGQYRMGFDLTPQGTITKLRVAIDYDLPSRGLERMLGRLFGRGYARWCTKKMVVDAQASLPPPQ
jgi:hypothetical protein